MSAKEDFSDQKFKIECSQMVLTNVGDNRLIVVGPGEIWQDERGVLQFKIFINQDAGQRLQAHLARPGVVGQLIPAEDYFRLEAREFSNPFWTAHNVLPSLRRGPAGGIAFGYLNELVQTKEYASKIEFAFVALRFRGKLAFPCNQGTETVIRVGGQNRHTSSALNAAFIDDGEYKFKVLHEREHTVVSLQLPAGQLTAATPFRIHEALQFVLGEQLALMVIETSFGGQHVTRLRSPSRGHGNMMPPLQFQRLEQDGHVWRMFTNYFRHVHLDADAVWHPISRHVGSAIESTAGSLEVTVLALVVAVEGLAGDCFPGLAPVRSELMGELDSVLAAMEQLDLVEQTRNRINGSINAMRAPRSSDVLRAFIANHDLPDGLFNSWKKLRNASAHGEGAGGRDIETILRLKSEVISLLYSLVLAAINYTGPRTDYSQAGWPTQIWPIPKPAADQPAASAPAQQTSPVAGAPSVPNPPAPTATIQTPTNPAPPEPTNSADP